mmetsp:Transcript_1029/g.2637  ORF Transcript_1029/g.2637 Transcript_1029/m.2637 type:complete len:250 (-) Transcript_1029:857-1606(-)
MPEQPRCKAPVLLSELHHVLALDNHDLRVVAVGHHKRRRGRVDLEKAHLPEDLPLPERPNCNALPVGLGWVRNLHPHAPRHDNVYRVDVGASLDDHLVAGEVDLLGPLRESVHVPLGQLRKGRPDMLIALHRLERPRSAIRPSFGVLTEPRYRLTQLGSEGDLAEAEEAGAVVGVDVDCPGEFPLLNGCDARQGRHLHHAHIEETPVEDESRGKHNGVAPGGLHTEPHVPHHPHWLFILRKVSPRAEPL